MGKLKNVFVSFSRRDEAAARSLIDELSRHNFFVSGGMGDFKADADWQKAVEASIRTADAVIVLLGSKAAPTKYQELEWSEILESHWADSFPTLPGSIRSLMTGRWCLSLRESCHG